MSLDSNSISVKDIYNNVEKYKTERRISTCGTTEAINYALFDAVQLNKFLDSSPEVYKLWAKFNNMEY